SRCMSMMTSAVLDRSRLIGSGSAVIVAVAAADKFAMSAACLPARMSRNHRSKRYAIVYNYRMSTTDYEVITHSMGWNGDLTLPDCWAAVTLKRSAYFVSGHCMQRSPLCCSASQAKHA